MQVSGELEHLPSETPEENEIEQENLDGVEDDKTEQEGNVHDRTPGQLDQQPVVIQPDYHQQKRAAKEKVKAFLGKKVVVKHKKQQMEQMVIEEWEPSNELQDLKPLGLTEFSVHDYLPLTVISNLFLHLAFIDWCVTLEN